MPTRFPMILLCASLILAGSRVRSEGATPVPGSTASATSSAQRDQILHVLNRVTFGVRPGDIEAVEKMGLHNYLVQQLHPETIDDSAVEKQLGQFNLLTLSQTELHQLYYGQRRMEAEAKQKKLDRQKAAIAAKAAGSQVATIATVTPVSPMTQQMQGETTGKAAPGKRAEKEDRRQQMESDITELMAANGDYISAVSQLQHAKLLRAIESQRQLQEVLVDFWGNHFNIDIKKKGASSVYKIADDREVIRPHIFGTFRELLGASAKSPAMLFYLDNAKNSAPLEEKGASKKAAPALAMTEMAPAATPAPLAKNGRGINENYAREIMELHTLGVDGGYTQKDVQEVARCFTGWTIDRVTGLFVFRPQLHDEGEKIVLGHTIPAHGGIKDGEKVLDILASQPACAQFISRELCERFVGDKPPQKLVDRVAAEFTATKGDLRAVTATILTSPEFLDPATYGNKIKSPMEFAVSAVRASNSSFAEARTYGRGAPRRDLESYSILGKGQAVDKYTSGAQQSLNWHVYTLGEPLFGCTPPTGYSEISSRWVSPGALIERLNFALALTEQRISDVHFSTSNVLGQADVSQPDKVLDQCVASLLQGHISPATRMVLAQATLPSKDAPQAANPNKLIALIIGSPEFQRK